MSMNISGSIKQKLLQFLGKQKAPELLATYLFYLEQALNINPVVFVRDKIILKLQKMPFEFSRKIKRFGAKQRYKFALGNQKLTNRQKESIYVLSLGKYLPITCMLILKMLFTIGCHPVLKTQSVKVVCA